MALITHDLITQGIKASCDRLSREIANFQETCGGIGHKAATVMLPPFGACIQLCSVCGHMAPAADAPAGAWPFPTNKGRDFTITRKGTDFEVSGAVGSEREAAYVMANGGEC